MQIIYILIWIHFNAFWKENNPKQINILKKSFLSVQNSEIIYIYYSTYILFVFLKWYFPKISGSPGRHLFSLPEQTEDLRADPSSISALAWVNTLREVTRQLRSIRLTDRVLQLIPRDWRNVRGIVYITVDKIISFKVMNDHRHEAGIDIGS